MYKSRATLTLEAMNLVEMYKHFTNGEIARRYGVSASTVSRIANEQFKIIEAETFEKQPMATPKDLGLVGFEGAWMNSQQRKDYKLIIKQNDKRTIKCS